ncbi:OMA1 (YKR087C) [Zygosaccharomyces parabailii]|nr:OMA1 (YKR087C) [Zygosaccharomyces parabailii]CDH15746.1 probable Mitochondrial metalloendopeptidase OMA1 [Zygosaccharomyces bailii ISA1307]SJM88192.1 probable Mitochondrial metalloendopeptidase OMA1 [Zygosaccharomyces bailii]
MFKHFGRFTCTSIRATLCRGAALRTYQQTTYRRFNNNQQSFKFDIYDPSTRKFLAILLGGGGLFYVANLKEAPVSGRRRFLWVPSSLEMMIGQSSYKSILRESRPYLLPDNHPTTQRVTEIFARIVDAALKDPTVDKSMLEGIQWKVHIVNDPRAPPNAFVLPGGKVFVYSSILGICQNDDGLATVLSHEFSHQLARHTGENLSKAPIYLILSTLLYTITGTEVLNRLLLDSIVRMPASRQMETEADYIGLMIMSRACFDPHESIKLWARMTEYEKKNVGAGARFEFLSTHPASEHRIENMRKWLPQASQLYDQSDCGHFGNYYKGFQNFFGAPEPPVILRGF